MDLTNTIASNVFMLTMWCNFRAHNFFKAAKSGLATRGSVGEVTKTCISFKNIENEFNSEIDRENLEAEDPQWFNSFNKYLTPREVLDFLVVTNENKLCFNDGSPIHTNKKHFIFVMDTQGNLYTNSDGMSLEGRRIGHPSFTQGKKVASAGEMKVEEGKVIEINNNSGHYQPGGYSLYRVVDELQKRGVLAGNVKIYIDKDDVGFPYKRGGWTLAEFQQQYLKNLKGQQPKALNLSEKPNPQRFLNTLKSINNYLSQRANETSGFLSLFNSFKFTLCSRNYESI